MAVGRACGNSLLMGQDSAVGPTASPGIYNWAGNPRGSFALKSAYSMPLAEDNSPRFNLGWVWKLAGNPRGSFALKSAYSMSLAEDNSPRFNLGWVWKLETLPRVKSFIWRSAHNSVGVKGYLVLVRRGMGEDDICPICQVESESILHALRDCARVKAVWI